MDGRLGHHGHITLHEPSGIYPCLVNEHIFTAFIGFEKALIVS